MLKILFIEDSEDMIDLVKQNIELELKCLLVSCTQIKQLSHLFDKHDKFDLIVCRESSDGDNVSKQLTNLLVNESFQTPTIIFSETPPQVDMEHAHYPLENYRPGQIIEIMASTLDPKKEHRKADIPDFVPFSMHYFFNLSKFESDIYIKLNKRSGDQFVKRINANEELDKLSLLKYRQSGLDELYIPKEFRFRFIDLAVEQTIDKIKSTIKQHSEGPNYKSLLEVGDNSYHLTSDLLGEIGISPQTVKLTETAVLQIRHTLKGQGKLAALLANLMKEDLSYAYKRCHLIAMFSLEVLKRIDWFSKDKLKENFEKMAYTSFLHDIILTDEKLLRIHSKLDLYKADLSDKEKELVLNHAHIVSSMAQRYPKCPAYIDTIIKQHHGTTNGIGFSENLNSGLSKLAIIFIVVEKFVIRILDFKKDDETLKDIIEDLNYEFSLPSYKKVMDCITEAILKTSKSK